MENLKEVFAVYNKQTIRVYQAYNSIIAKEAVSLQTFGKSFSLNRMTWIKPSFLWMMYRSGWATKKNQECILAIDVYREKFDEILKQAVLTSPDSKNCNGMQWQAEFSKASCYCQWDPERNINGDPINRRAIQLGIKGDILKDFVNSGICKIEDITLFVKKCNEQRKNGKLKIQSLPQEKLYPVTDLNIRNRLGM